MSQFAVDTLAAASLADHPIMLASTDGQTWQTMRVRGKMVVLWANVDTTTAYSHLIHFLKKEVSFGTFGLLDVCVFFIT